MSASSRADMSTTRAEANGGRGGDEAATPRRDEGDWSRDRRLAGGRSLLVNVQT